MQIDDIFIQNIEGDDLSVPPEYKKLKKSQCTVSFNNQLKSFKNNQSYWLKPLFMVAYKERNAGAVIHTHSSNAVMVFS